MTLPVPRCLAFAVRQSRQGSADQDRRTYGAKGSVVPKKTAEPFCFLRLRPGTQHLFPEFLSAQAAQMSVSR